MDFRACIDVVPSAGALARAARVSVFMRSWDYDIDDDEVTCWCSTCGKPIYLSCEYVPPEWDTNVSEQFVCGLHVDKPAECQCGYDDVEIAALVDYIEAMCLEAVRNWEPVIDE